MKDFRWYKISQPIQDSVSTFDIPVKEKFDQVYFPFILKQVEQYSGKLLEASEKQRVVEGNWLRGRTMLWEFPDVETVQTWYRLED